MAVRSTIRAALLVMCLTTFALAQQDPPGPRRVFDPAQGQRRGDQPIRVLRATPAFHAAARGAFSLARDSDAEQWIKKAVAAGERQEWKLAIDTLWRIIDQYGDAIVSTDGKSGSAASETAWNLLRSWPPAALETYRTLYEPEAARLLAESEQRGDVDGVRRVASKYLLTPSGGAGLELLAAWMLDQGRPFEAAAALRRLKSLPPPAPPAWSVDMKLAAAEAACGHAARAEEILAGLEKLVVASQPSEGLPPDFAERLRQLRAYVASAVPGARTQPDAGGWWALMGGGACTGRMAAVNPSFTTGASWSMPLPGTIESWSGTLPKLCARAGIGPIWQPATDGRRIYVRYPSGVLAVDATTFDPVWQGQCKPRERLRYAPMRMLVPMATDPDTGQRLDDVLSAAEFRALTDELAGAVSVRRGRVFVIEPPREVVEGSAVFQQLGGGRMQAVVDPWSSELSENSLHAFDVETGKLVWSKGADGPLADGLAQAHFLSPPVPCGDKLIAPYVNAENFCLAVLQPDGRLVRSIVLGTAPPALFPSKAILQPTVAEPLVFVPTGCGVLLALDSYDLGLRWTAGYTRDAPSTRTETVMVRSTGASTIMEMPIAPPNWASNPPVVAGNLVLLAGPESDQLLAFERETGQLRWTAPRKDHHFIVGCDDRRVYLSGTRLAAVELSSGEPAWSCEELRPSGRPALSGDRIFVPTLSGVAVVAADDGRVLSQDEFATERSTCGNLLAWDGSLYNVSVNALERIPDLAQSVAQAEARLKTEPGDRAALLRLAVLQYQRGELVRTRELLEQARDSTSARPDARIDDQLSHLWVQTHLDLARDATADERDGLLQSAAEQARRPGDVLRVELALIDADAASAGVPHAMERGVALLRRIGGGPAELDGGLTALGWVPIAERLERLWSETSAADRAAVDRAIESTIAGLTDRGARTLLADALGFAPAAARLDLAIGSELSEAGDVESADFFLSRAARRSESSAPQRAGVALMELIKLLGGSREGVAAQPERAAAEFARLERVRTAARTDAASDSDSFAARLDAFLAEWAPRLARGSGAAGQDAADLDRWSVLDDRARVANADPLFTIFRPATGSPGALTILGLQRQLIALDTIGMDDGTGVWTAATNESLTAYATRSDWGVSVSPLLALRPGAIAGGIAIIPSENGYYPLGLPTGRAMGPSLNVASADAGAIDPRVAGSDGWFVAALDDHTLAGWPAREWTGPVWRRAIPRISIASVRAADGFVVVANREQDDFVVVRPWSGRIQARIRPYSSDEPGHVGRAQRRLGVAAGPFLFTADGQAAAAWHVASGRALWRYEFPAPVVGLSALDAAHVGVSWGDNRFTVLGAADGRRAADVTVDDANVPPSAAVIDQGTLLLSLPTQNDPMLTRLSAFDASTGSALWTFGPMAQAVITDAMLRALPRWVAYVETYAVREESETTGMQFPGGVVYGRSPFRARVGFIDKLTGSRVRRPIVLSGSRNDRAGQPIDARVTPQRIFVTTSNGCFVLGPGGDAPVRTAEPVEQPDEETP